MTPDQITQLRQHLNEIFAIADSGHEPDETHGLARIEQLAKQALALLACLTCNGNKKVEVCNNCHSEGSKRIMQQIDTYPKLVRCFICGSGTPKVIPCPDCQEHSP